LQASVLQLAVNSLFANGQWCYSWDAGMVCKFAPSLPQPLRLHHYLQRIFVEFVFSGAKKEDVGMNNQMLRWFKYLLANHQHKSSAQIKPSK